MELIFNIIVVLWYIIYMILLIHLYFANSRPYNFEQKVDIKNNNRKLEDLSFIIYKKLKPEVITATIVKLINTRKIKVIFENEDFWLIKNDDDNLTKAEFNIMDLLFEIVGNGTKVSLNSLINYCNNSRGCSNFLMNYELWKKFATIESNKSKLFEMKTNYRSVKLVKNTGLLIFVLNFLFRFTIGFDSFFAYFTLIPSIFIIIYFYNISKLNYETSQEYYGWIVFRKELKENNKLLDNDRYFEYAIILNCYDNLENTKKLDFIKKLDLAINKCYVNAVLKGNRSLFK